MAIALNLALCFKPLTRKIQASVGFLEKRETTDKQKEKHTFVCCFSVARKFLSAFWTLHNNLVSNFDFDIIFETKRQ